VLLQDFRHHFGHLEGAKDGLRLGFEPDEPFALLTLDLSGGREGARVEERTRSATSWSPVTMEGSGSAAQEMVASKSWSRRWWDSSFCSRTIRDSPKSERAEKVDHGELFMLFGRNG